MRWVVPFALVGLAACGPGDAIEVRRCDDVVAHINPPRSPSDLPAVLPIAVGDPLPLVRMEPTPREADALLDRTLAMVCRIADGPIEAGVRPQAWAHDVVEAPARRRTPLTLEPGIEISAVYRPWGATSLSVSTASQRMPASIATRRRSIAPRRWRRPNVRSPISNARGSSTPSRTH